MAKSQLAAFAKPPRLSALGSGAGADNDMTNTQKLLPIVVAAIVLALLVSAVLWQRRLDRGLAERVVACASRAEALRRANQHALDHGGLIIAVLGTGSMAPIIPAAGAGKDPRTTDVAFAVTEPGARFSDIKSGTPVLYSPNWAQTVSACVLHSATSKTGEGEWIMTGLANRNYETWEPLTPEKFRGIPAVIYTWPQ